MNSNILYSSIQSIRPSSAIIWVNRNRYHSPEDIPETKFKSTKSPPLAGLLCFCLSASFKSSTNQIKYIKKIIQTGSKATSLSQKQHWLSHTNLGIIQVAVLCLDKSLIQRNSLWTYFFPLRTFGDRNQIQDAFPHLRWNLITIQTKLTKELKKTRVQHARQLSGRYLDKGEIK